jgi:Na+/H+ antiporter NhaD/arsenite permease-like protein
MFPLFAVAALLWLFLPSLLRRMKAWKSQSEEERSVAIRFTIFSWVLAFIFVTAALFLPNKGRVILLLPLFLIGATLARWWQNTRDRIRRKNAMDTNFGRARRIN